MKLITRITGYMASHATAGLDVPSQAGDYADPAGYVPRPVPHMARLVDEQTGLDLSLASESWRLDLSQHTETTTVTTT